MRDWSWRHATREAWALRGVTLLVEPGERVLVAGASGSGKSTLVRALAGVLGADEGEFSGGMRVDDAPPAPGRAGLLLQDPNANVILPHVADDVAFGAENLGVDRREIVRRIPRALSAVGLAGFEDRETATLSGGTVQRVALAGILAMQPGLVLLDEPTANLDDDGVRAVRAAVANVHAETGATVVVVDHRVDVWFDWVDRLVVLAPDGVVVDGEPATLREKHAEVLQRHGLWVPGLGAPATGRPVASRALLSHSVLDAHALVVGHPGGAAIEVPDVSLSAGRALAITGRNGAGKSTLLSTFGGLQPPRSGRVTVAGRAEPHRWRSRELAARVGTVFQNPEHQFVARTVRDEVAVGPRLAGHDLGDVDDLLERFALAHLARAHPLTLSGGEQRRLSVATAVAAKPELLLLDEPTFGQDRHTWSEVVSACREYADAGGSVVAATHDRALVAALADAELVLS